MAAAANDRARARSGGVAVTRPASTDDWDDVTEGATPYEPPHKATRKKAKPASDAAGERLTDDALALAFVDKHGQDLRYCGESSRWYVWQGTHFAADVTGAVVDRIRKYVRPRAAVAQKKEAEYLEAAKTIAAIERLARSDRQVAVSIAQLDADPWLLGTPGGVVDLRSGGVRPARPVDLITKLTAAAPRSGAPKWAAFLSSVTRAKPGLSEFLQRYFGYALTGLVRDHRLLFVYGPGANGKSVLLNTVARAFGDYARPMPIEALLDQRTVDHPTAIAGLLGARLVTAAEVERNRRWSSVRLKALTGGDRLTARFMRQDYFDFNPTFKICISGNAIPSLAYIDEAVRRRLLIVPMDWVIPEAERNLNLSDELEPELGGVLQWLIDGCRDWDADGLQPPAVITEASESYFASEDNIAMWIAESCSMGPEITGRAGELFASWKLWCDRAGERAGSAKAFGQALRQRGIATSRSMSARCYQGIDVTAEERARVAAAHAAKPIFRP